jgi:vancomycin resistance protein YoaR
LFSPGEEFSTVGSLGTIDNSTGYLPELVIKGDETIPEFGGGLCQVSTTLFRSVMNAGLPVVERRNHSYRVPYYERDGEGNFIGPGLDATIYDPWPDFKFRNDTSSHILIQGFVEGTKVTFELYGTGDGRKSVVDGPTILEETDPPEPVYTETNELPLGERKKIDTAHPGGVAVATYTVEYSDGRVEEQEFKSYYRKWPEKWLVGTATSTKVQ